MPTYVFTCTCGMSKSETVKMSQRKNRLKCVCGKWAPRDMAAEQRKTRSGGCGAWPMVGWAAGVHRNQLPQARKKDAEAGVGGTEYTDDGCPIFTGRGHRKQYLKAWGLHDKNGGYGD